MITLRDFYFFLSGFLLLHTLSHIMIPYYHAMPLDCGFMVLTADLNLGIIILGAILTVLFFILGVKRPR